MAYEDIVIKIDLDTGAIKKESAEIETNLVKAANESEKAFNKTDKSLNSVSDSVKQLNIQISQTNKQIADVSKTTKEVEKSLISKDTFQKLGTAILAVGSGMAFVAANADDLKTTLKALGVTFQPIYRIIDAISLLFSEFSNLTGIEALNKVFSDSNRILFNLLTTLNFIPQETIAVSAGLSGLAGSFFLLRNRMSEATSAASVMFNNFKANAQSVGGIFSGFSKTLFGNITNIYGLVSALSAVAAGLALFGRAFERSNNEVLRIAASLATFAAIILGGFAAAIGFAILKVGELAFSLGSKIVDSAQKATQTFLKANQSLTVFNATIDNFNRITSNAIGTSEEWDSLLNDLSATYNLSTISLQKSAAEIINVGTQLGLNADQLKELTKISAEYAAINQKDVFDTSVALVSALNGQSQAALNLGLKLGEQSNILYTLKNNYKNTFDQLAEGEKVQVRYNNLLKQYENVAGIGIAAATSWGAQNQRLTNNVEKLNIKLGQGAAYVEDLNIVALATNKILENVSDSVFAVTGFIGALGGRILQAGGLFLEWSLKIYAVIKAYNLLQVILSASVTQSAFAKSLPFLNMSLNQLVETLAGMPVKIDSAKKLLEAIGLIVKNQGDLISKVLLGVSTSSLTLSNAFTVLSTVVTQRVIPAIRLISIWSARILMAFLPVIGTIAIVVGVFKLFSTAVEEINKRTDVLSRTFSVLAEPFKKLIDSTSILKTAFNDIASFIGVAFGRVVGFIAFGITKIFEGITFLAQKNPFKVFSQSSVKQLEDINLELKVFNEQLLASGFNLNGMAQRSIALVKSTGNATEVNLEQLRSLQDELKNVGKTQLQILTEQKDSRIKLLNEALAAELLSEQKYSDLKKLVLIDFDAKRKELMDKTKSSLLEFDSVFLEGFGLKFGSLVESSTEQLQRFAQVGQEVGARVQQALGQMAANGIQRFARMLITGKNQFKDFGKYILGTMGELATQIGTLMLTAGIGMLALSGLDPVKTMMAGAALIAIGEVFKALSGGSGENAAAAAAAPGGVGADFGPSPESGSITESTKPKSSIVVNIQGDVLDSDSTGMRIVSLIQDYADKNGNAEVFA